MILSQKAVSTYFISFRFSGKISVILFFFTLLTQILYAQNKFVIDGDEVLLRDSGQYKLLTSIHQHDNNSDNIWVEYNRRPGVDEWMRKRNGTKTDYYSTESFLEFFASKDIRILGAFVTYDPCLCIRHRTTSNPDLFLINFKVTKKEWEKILEWDPEISHYAKFIQTIKE